MVFAFIILYVMKSLRIISFTTDESQRSSNNPTMFVPFRTLVHTLPLAFTYLIFM
ncbi:UDP-N-acetylglucosamine/UDP-glucose/GDP-mannose transporter, partial [Sesbania bispinosa]